MSVKVTKFTEKASLYTIEDGSGVSAAVTDFGAVLVHLIAPDRDGNGDDIVLGYDEPETYLKNPNFFGATVGPSANRISHAEFAIDGRTYKLLANDNGNNLHSSDDEGFHKRLWAAEPGSDSVRFSLDEPDGALGFPGNRHVEVTYSLKGGKLEIHYYAESDAKTVINMTNHSYFNLNGAGHGDILGHEMTMNASRFTPGSPILVPTGEVRDVAGTPFDFTSTHLIGERFDADDDQIRAGHGYDHNYLIDGADGSVRLFATVYAPESGRQMRAYTNLPAFQFYAGCCIAEQTGRDGAHYGPRCALCLESQFVPDAVHLPQFTSPVFGPDRIYDYTTVYELTTR